MKKATIRIKDLI